MNRPDWARLEGRRCRKRCIIFPIIKSFLEPKSLAERIAAAYGLKEVSCQLITATLRDVYLVRSAGGQHILIVYRHDDRSDGEITAEWRFVEYLAGQQVPVAPAVLTIDGELLLTFAAPEGIRYGVLSCYVDGQHLRRRSSEAAVRRYGEIIATIHRLGDAAPASVRRSGRALTTRLEEAMMALERVLVDQPAVLRYLTTCTAGLQTRLQALGRAAPEYGPIHGDVIRTNALVAEDGNVTVIDFDWYGMGWRAYDVASYLLTIRGEAQEYAFASAFLSGYQAIRPLTDEEKQWLPLFEAARAILEMGTPAVHVNLWGRAYFDAFFEQSFERLESSMQRLP